MKICAIALYSTRTTRKESTGEQRHAAKAPTDNRPAIQRMREQAIYVIVDFIDFGEQFIMIHRACVVFLRLIFTVGKMKTNVFHFV